MCLHEVIGEKVRAAVQRSRVRDLYDLYQLARQPYNRDVVRRIAMSLRLEPDSGLSVGDGVATRVWDAVTGELLAQQPATVYVDLDL